MTDTQIPNQLRPFIEARREVGKVVRQAVKDVLLMSTQPLTVLEIQRASERIAHRSVDNTHVRVVLAEFHTSGLVSTRTETVEERLLRANGKASRGYLATLYWAHGTRVPARTVAEAIPGLSLEYKAAPKVKAKNTRGRPKGSKNKVKKTSGLVATSKSMTVEVSTLVDEIVRLRTLELQSKISTLENKLAAIKKTLA